MPAVTEVPGFAMSTATAAVSGRTNERRDAVTGDCFTGLSFSRKAGGRGSPLTLPVLRIFRVAYLGRSFRRYEHCDRSGGASRENSRAPSGLSASQFSADVSSRTFIGDLGAFRRDSVSVCISGSAEVVGKHQNH